MGCWDVRLPDRRIHEGGREDSIWDVFCRIPGKIADNADAGQASDHYCMLEEDLDLLAAYKMPHYRFSLSWPRLLSNGTGAARQSGIDFYNRLIDGLLARSITPWVTLYHWDLPQSLQDKGGWTNRDIVGWFGDYAEFVLKTFGDRVSNWIILNEPSVTSLLGHAYGLYAPGLASERAYASSAHHQNLAVGHAARIAKSYQPGGRIGSSYHYLRVLPESEKTPDDAIHTMDALWNGNFFDPLFKGEYPSSFAALFDPLIRPGDPETCRAPLDFIGLQHYANITARRSSDHAFKTFFGAKNPQAEKTDIGWFVDPQDFTVLLEDFKTRYGNMPIIITENGAVYDDALQGEVCDDPKRIYYLKRYIGAAQAAIERGVNIQGYFAWSLLDNFEWSDGYGPRFGLVHVNYDENCRRTPKSSLKWYQKIIANNGPFSLRSDGGITPCYP